MAASLERGDVTGYNKRFAEHSVARETVPFSAWKQSRGLLSWTISVVGAQAKGRTSNFFFSVCYGIQLREKRCRSSSTQPREWEGGGRIVGSKHAPPLFRFHVNFVSPWSEMPRVRVVTSGYDSWIILRIIYGISDGRMDGWKCWSIVSR